MILCGITASLLMTGCGAMPDLTQEETELISEYAVGVLLKYDKSHGSRLVDTSAYDKAEEEPALEELPAEPIPEEEETEALPDTTEIMDATHGTQLLVLKFSALNTGNEDQSMNMLQYGARFRVSVNGEASKGALATMLLNDMQTYDDVIPAGSSVELVSIVEVPQDISIESIDFILRGKEEKATLRLQ